jgi:hypothetical protein
MKAVVVVKVRRKACNAVIGKEIESFKSALDSPDCLKSVMVFSG